MCAAKLNHIRIGFRLPDDRLLKSATADDYFRRCLELKIYPFVDDIEAIYRTIDANPKGFANRICQNPRKELHLAAVAATWRVVKKCEEKLQERDAIVGHSYVSYGGHFSVSAARVTGLVISEEVVRNEDLSVDAPEFPSRHPADLPRMDDKLGVGE